ncbi:MAG: type II secretion system major pseudopilin GspG [Candidatus Sumerlaeota bacterium]|nr:type II secretion system major pseudopilin GspG [Candidatus Sumerlaeota bacterium]
MKTLNPLARAISQHGARRRGFTFMEIMLVVVIIGILAAIVVPNIFHHGETARENATRTNLENIKTALQLYYLRVGEFPTTNQGLGALKTCPSDVDPNKWGNRPYLEGNPKDSWGNDFIYRSPGEHSQDFDLVSPGKDGQEGTADDIVNWQKEESTKPR